MSTLRAKTVVVTGGSGFIGAHLVRRLRELNLGRLVLVCRKPLPQAHNDDICVISPLEELAPSRWQAAGVERVDVLFHLGAFIPKSAAESNDISAVYRSNLMGTRSLLESLPAVPECLVFASTADVYRTIQNGAPISEDSSTDPGTLYAASKLFCEQLVKHYAVRTGCYFAILRYGHIFGPGEQAYAKLIPEAIRAILRGEPPLLYSDGSTERDLLFVGDAVEATVRAVERREGGNIGALNVVRGQSVSAREIIRLLSRIMDSSIEPRFLPNRPEGPSLCFDNTQMLRRLGSWELVSLEEGLCQEISQWKSESEPKA